MVLTCIFMLISGVEHNPALLILCSELSHSQSLSQFLGESCPVFFEYSVSIFSVRGKVRAGVILGAGWGCCRAGGSGEQGCGRPGRGAWGSVSSSALVGGQRHRQCLLLPGCPPLPHVPAAAPPGLMPLSCCLLLFQAPRLPAAPPLPHKSVL